VVVTAHERLDSDCEFIEGGEGMSVLVLVFEKSIKTIPRGMVVTQTGHTHRTNQTSTFIWNPVAQRHFIVTELTSNLDKRTLGIDHPMHRFNLLFRAE